MEAVEKAIGRLTNAIAEGGELTSLVEALRTQELQRRELLLELNELNVATKRPTDLRQQLDRYLTD